MKTVLDAVNEFKGVWPYLSYPSIICSKGTHTSYKLGEFSSYIDDGDSDLNKDMWTLVCDIAQFNQCVEDCSNNFGKKAKPLYTTKMQEAGDLPGVGMECMVRRFHENDSALIGCYIIGYSKDKCWLVFENDKDELLYHNIKNGTFTFKSIDTRTDREKALDGLRWNGEGLTAKACVLALDLIMSGKIHGVTFAGSK